MVDPVPTHRLTRLTLLCVGLWGLAVMCTFFWEGNTLLDRIEWRTVDWRFQLRGPIPPSRDLAIVAVDEQSIREIGRWPWPRERFATLTNELAKCGAKRIVFDVFFTEPDRGNGGVNSDEALLTATRRAGTVYHAGFLSAPQAGQSTATMPGDAAWSHTPVVRASGLASVASLIEPPGLTLPLPALARAARGVGIANVLDSGDGVYRHIVPLVSYEGAIYPSMTLALAADLLDVTPERRQIVPGKCVQLGTEEIPLDMQGRLLVNFVGKPGHAYPYVSAADALAQKGTAGDRLRGKIVLVGVTAPGIYDLRASPYETNFNGVETEANAIDNVLTNRFLRQMPPLETGLLLLAIILVFGLLLPRLTTSGLCLAAIAGIAGYPWLATWLFTNRSLVVALVHPTFAMLGSFLIILVMRVLVEERRRNVAHSLLRHFVPPQLVGRLVEEEALTTMRGERREISVFFADLRNFTSSAEALAPEDTVIFLNRYFALMNEIIWEHGGTLDKYIGDEIMVFYNAPLTQAEHAQLAVMTAIDMQRRIMANQAEWEYLQVPGLNAGIGIASGPAVVGCIGSGERMQYTVIGMTVNLASRLQALCKQFGCRILIADATYQAVVDVVEAEDLGEVAVPGFQQPVRVWHVLDYKHPEMRGHWPPVDEPVKGQLERSPAP